MKLLQYTDFLGVMHYPQEKRHAMMLKHLEAYARYRAVPKFQPDDISEVFYYFNNNPGEWNKFTTFVVAVEEDLVTSVLNTVFTVGTKFRGDYSDIDGIAEKMFGSIT